MTPDELDQITIDLLFALRDSLTDVSPLDFWSGRAATALETAAAGADDMHEAITIAARKLQVAALTTSAAKRAVAATNRVTDYQQWADHVTRNLVWIIALAQCENADKKAASKAAREAAQPIPF